MIFECTPAQTEALTTILRYEDIPYVCGIGPGCIAIEVDKKHASRAKKALSDWREAVSQLHTQTLFN